MDVNNYVEVEVTDTPEERKSRKKHFSKIGLFMFLGTLIIYAVQYGSLYISSHIPAIYEDSNLRFLVSMLPMYIICYPIIYLLLKQIPADTTTQKKKMKTSHIFVSFFICYAATYVLNIIGTIITTIIGIFKQDAVSNVMFDIVSDIHPLANFLIIVIAAPILEELLFRKWIIDRTARFGEGISVVVSGIMFGLFHGNLGQTMYATAIGMLFAYIYVKTRNIRYSIILHMCLNFLGGFLSSLLLRASGYMEMLQLANGNISPRQIMALFMDHWLGLVLLFLYAFCLLGFVIAGVVLFIVNRHKFTFCQGEVSIPKGQFFSTAFLNVGMLLFCGYWIVMIIRQLVS